MANGPQCLLEACRECQNVKMYDVNGERVKTVHEPYNSRTLCRGPGGSILTLDNGGLLRKLTWTTGTEDLQEISSIETKINRPRDMCYVDTHSIVSVIASVQVIRESALRGLTLRTGPQFGHSQSVSETNQLIRYGCVTIQTAEFTLLTFGMNDYCWLTEQTVE